MSEVYDVDGRIRSIEAWMEQIGEDLVPGEARVRLQQLRLEQLRLLATGADS